MPLKSCLKNNRANKPAFFKVRFIDDPLTPAEQLIQEVIQGEEYVDDGYEKLLEIVSPHFDVKVTQDDAKMLLRMLDSLAKTYHLENMFAVKLSSTLLKTYIAEKSNPTFAEFIENLFFDVLKKTNVISPPPGTRTLALADDSGESTDDDNSHRMHLCSRM